MRLAIFCILYLTKKLTSSLGRPSVENVTSYSTGDTNGPGAACMHNHYDYIRSKESHNTYAYIALLPGHTPGNEANAYTIDASFVICTNILCITIAWEEVHINN